MAAMLASLRGQAYIVLQVFTNTKYGAGNKIFLVDYCLQGCDAVNSDREVPKLWRNLLPSSP
jgi:hypothetical protein